MSSDGEEATYNRHANERRGPRSDTSDAANGQPLDTSGKDADLFGDESEGDAGLFGDEKDGDGGRAEDDQHSDQEEEREPEDEDEEAQDRRGRRLDDEALDSGDDDDRYDRRGYGDEALEDEDTEMEEKQIVKDFELARAPNLESTNGEVYTLSMPNFLSIESEDFNPETYVAPPFNAASTSLCWRYDPVDGKTVQSNARIIKWSDGSMTLQLASNPREQYMLSSKPLSRPNDGSYDPRLDSHVYLGMPSESSNVIRIGAHLTSSLTVLPINDETDDAVERLAESMAAARKAATRTEHGSVAIVDIKEDPDFVRKQAEQAEREKTREMRRREAAQEREIGRRYGGASRAGGAGLTIASLEDDPDMMAPKGSAKRPRKKSSARRQDFSDEEVEGQSSRYGQEGYDRDDDFIADSDEELETYGDEEEDILDDGANAASPNKRHKSTRTSRRQSRSDKAKRPVVDEDEDE